MITEEQSKQDLRDAREGNKFGVPVFKNMLVKWKERGVIMSELEKIFHEVELSNEGMHYRIVELKKIEDAVNCLIISKGIEDFEDYNRFNVDRIVSFIESLIDQEAYLKYSKLLDEHHKEVIYGTYRYKDKSIKNECDRWGCEGDHKYYYHDRKTGELIGMEDEDEDNES